MLEWLSKGKRQRSYTVVYDIVKIMNGVVICETNQILMSNKQLPIGSLDTMSVLKFKFSTKSLVCWQQMCVMLCNCTSLRNVDDGNFPEVTM